MLLNKQISITYFLRLIKWDVTIICVYSILVGTLDHFSFLRDISIPLGVSALVGTLLSLLLAFRTSQSYERWWEARIIWGAIVNDSRTLIRQLIYFLPAGDGKQQRLRNFALRQAIWCYTLTDSLRRVPFSDKVNDYFKTSDKDSDNRPNLLLSQHTKELIEIADQYNLDANKQVQLDQTIVKLTDSMGKCERIKNTVFPRSYSILIHFLIYVLMTMLPFGLDDNHWIIEIVICTLVPVLFIAIERTAILMQDPFDNRPTDTPMSTLSATIERNLLDMIDVPLPVQVSQKETFYIM